MYHLDGCLLVGCILLIFSACQGFGTTTLQTSNITTIKTIQGDYGDTVDCYDIYKQPTLDNHLFRNHKIQMEPTSYPTGMHPSGLGTINSTQSWHKNGTCPRGTIPVIRFENSYNSSKTILSHRHFSDNGHVYKTRNQDNTSEYEVAGISLKGDDFRGATAKINIWKPSTEAGEYSAAVISVIAGDVDASAEAISVGWQVHPDMYDGDGEPRLFIYRRDQSTKCYDLECPGFVQTSSSDVTLGCKISPISIFQGSQYDGTFSIFQDISTGNWWVQVQGVNVGYWSSSLFKQLSTKATKIEFGGVIRNARNQERHTSTEMGSGHLPSEGNFGVSSYFSQVKVIDQNQVARDPGSVEVYHTNKNCYGLSIDGQGQDGYRFFYGGPGFSNNCQ